MDCEADPTQPARGMKIECEGLIGLSVRVGTERVVSKLVERHAIHQHSRVVAAAVDDRSVCPTVEVDDDNPAFRLFAGELHSETNQPIVGLMEPNALYRDGRVPLEQ